MKNILSLPPLLLMVATAVAAEHPKNIVFILTIASVMPISVAKAQRT